MNEDVCVLKTIDRRSDCRSLVNTEEMGSPRATRDTSGTYIDSLFPRCLSVCCWVVFFSLWDRLSLWIQDSQSMYLIQGCQQPTALWLNQMTTTNGSNSSNSPFFWQSSQAPTWELVSASLCNSTGSSFSHPTSITAFFLKKKKLHELKIEK